MAEEEKKEEQRITTFSLYLADKEALDMLVELLKRSNRTDTVRFLIWSALEANFPEIYKRLKGGTK